MSCLSCNINPTRFAINFDTIGVPHMQFLELICISDIHMDHLGINLDQFLWVPILLKLVPEFLKIINPIRFAIYFDTLGVPDMQFSELICKSYINMDHLGINVYQFLWVPSIA